jgi:hypothetical protein
VKERRVAGIQVLKYSTRRLKMRDDTVLGKTDQQKGKNSCRTVVGDVLKNDFLTKSDKKLLTASENNAAKKHKFEDITIVENWSMQIFFKITCRFNSGNDESGMAVNPSTSTKSDPAESYP